MNAGETRDLHFDFKPTPGIRISGHVSNAGSAPYFQLSRETPDGLIALEDDHRWNPAASTFEFPAVIPGKYLLTVQSTSPTAMRANKRIVVGPSELSGLELTLEAPHQLDGIIRSDDDTRPANVEVSFARTSAGTPEYTMTDQDGTFKLALSDNQPYDIWLYPLPWHVQSIKRAGHDIIGRLLEPLPDGSWGKIEIVASRSHGSIQGTLRGATDQTYLVRLLQERSLGYRVAAVMGCGGLYGKFELNNVPSGEYRVLVSSGKTEIPYLEPTYLASRAEFVAVVRVVDGQTSTVEVAPVPDDFDPRR